MACFKILAEDKGASLFIPIFSDKVRKVLLKPGANVIKQYRGKLPR